MLVLIIFSLAFSWPMRGQEQKPTEPFRLTIENIMKGSELVGSEPSNILWSVDGKKLYFRWKKPGEKATEFYFITRQNLVPQKTNLQDILKLPPLLNAPATSFRMFGFGPFGAEVKFDKARKRALLVQNGDISLLDIGSGKLCQLTFTDARESNANFGFDEKKIYYTSEENLYLASLEDHSLRQMTSFTRKSPPAERMHDELANWYSQQQKDIFAEFKKEQSRMRFEGMRPTLSSLSTPSPPKRKPFYLRENQNLTYLELSPDEKYVIFIMTESVPEEKSTIVPNYVTRTGFTETIESHAKAAYPSRTIKAGIIVVSSGDVKWIDYNQGERKIHSGNFFWSPDRKTCLHTARADDRKDHWLFRLDISSGKTETIEQIHDEAWVGPLGLTNIFWWPDSQHISYISEKSGFAHLYKISLDKKEKKQMTSGKFEVLEARLSQDGKTIYLTSNEEHPGEKHFYSMPAQGGKRTKVTSLVGQNQAFLSPDESYLAVLYSATNRPPELYFQANKPGTVSKPITLSTTAEFRSYSWVEPEIKSLKARDGVDIYVRLFKPQNSHAKKPAVIFIHGAGYLQNAHRGWSTYFHEYLFHNFLMEKGYTILDVDYRGSAGYGRDFRTAIYRHMGGKDLEDIVDAARFLVKNYDINPERIGVYGGSYGGFLTLMAMFKNADVFKAGAALRPVTDWAHYHPNYTVDILNLPDKDPEAYKQSSPIYFAEGLKGALLICHGMVDTNVHFQDTARLTQRLIELGKENFDVAIYPVENHSFQNSSSWTDEYRRIFKLFEENLKQ